jgi:transcriptional regulator with XRE-family HTH domain
VSTGPEPSPFGRELRRLREQRGLSLQKFADLVNYSRGYIGKVEIGDKPPTGELARRCDEVLEAGGTLTALAAGAALPRLAQLPAVPATFVGREPQLERLTTELLRDGPPGTPTLVAVDGPTCTATPRPTPPRAPPPYWRNCSSRSANRPTPFLPARPSAPPSTGPFWTDGECWSSWTTPANPARSPRCCPVQPAAV